MDLEKLKEGFFHTARAVKDLNQAQRKTFDRFIAKGYEDSQALYHMVYPNPRTNCTNPACSKQAVYERRIIWGYRPYCSLLCAKTDPKNKEKAKVTCLRKYGGPSPFSSASVRQKAVKTCQNNYGVDNPAQSSKVQKKISKTNKARYGGRSPFSSAKIRQKSVRTCKRKYGVTNISQDQEIKDKKVQTSLKNYGCNHPRQSKEVKRQTSNTCLRKYGVEHVSQVPSILEKQQIGRYGRHDIVLNTKKFTYQGYEGYALKLLVNKFGVKVNHIHNAPKEQKRIITNTGRHYFPDIRIKTGDKDISIEVKSVYTCGATNFDIFFGVRQKAKAAFEAGVDLRIWIIDPPKKRLVRIKNFHDLTWKGLHDKLSK
jgi:hypothetical protein